MKYLKRYNESLEDEVSKFTSKRNTKSINKSKEEAWYEFLDSYFPAPAIIGPDNKVVNGRLVEGKRVFYILDKDFDAHEQVYPVFDRRGEFSEEVENILREYGFKREDINNLGESIEDAKLSIFNNFCLDNWENKFKKESSDEFIQFEKYMRDLGKAKIDSFLND